MNINVNMQLVLFALLILITTVSTLNQFSCSNGWDLNGLHCYKFFNIKTSWEKSAELCERYGATLVTIDSYAENNITSYMVKLSNSNNRKYEKYWLGLTTLDDLRTNTLESTSGSLVSQYSGFWALNHPNPENGECVSANTNIDRDQTWELSSCETLLPFMCRANACPQNSFHCSNGNCINKNSKCDNLDDCGDNSDEIDCPVNCNFHMQSGGDVIESINYPHKYNALSKCKWTLEGPLGSNIILQFQDFDTERSYDSVQILTGGRTEKKSVTLASLSGKMDLTMKPFVTASNFMIIKFTTDGSVERKGFRATWKTETKSCSNTLQASSQGNVLSSPNYPSNYPGGIECLYIIKAEPGKVISIEIQELDINNHIDYLLIRDGGTADHRPIARLTGNSENNEKVIISTGNQLYLYFNSKYGNTGKGFSLKYSEGCKVTITANNGSISSPSFGLENYPTNQDCLYYVRNALKTPLSLKFDKFDIHTSDFVEIYDGLSTNGLKLHSGNGFTGSNVPKLTLTASSGEMLIKFTSDALNNGPGWSAIFSADCPTLKAGIGAIASNLDTAFRTVVTFTCPLGQEFSTGKNKIVSECVSGGFWNIDYIPNCQEVYCGPVPQIDNGFSIGSTNVTYKGIAMYQCYAGFTFLNSLAVDKISCLADGNWEPKPACVASQCSNLPEVPHSNITILNGGGKSYGTIVQYECQYGYERRGSPVLICSGNWSADIPKCTRKKCRQLPSIPNGFIVDKSREYAFGDEARVQCYKGFKLNGNNIIRCDGDQAFKNIPSCVDINECLTTQCDLTTTDCVNTNGSFLCGCKEGFSPTTDCHRIGDLGLSNGGLPDDSIIASISEEGYTPEMARLNSVGWCGSSLESGRNWVIIDFRAPIILKGFRTMSVQRFDEKIAFSSAVRLQFTNNLTDVFKDYTNPDGTAVEFRILEPTLSILNLPMPIEARYIKFKIQDFVGSPCIRLEAMGCNRLDCVDNNECATKNGWCDQKCINSPGSYACSCNNGFELFKSNGTAGFHIANFETGKREGDIYFINKTCVPVMCPRLVSPKNGLLLSSKVKYNYGDIVTFQCDFGFIMSGNKALSCLASGNWNATVPECNYAKCISLSDDKNEGLIILRPNMDIPLVSFKENVTLTCTSLGRNNRGSTTANIRQCVFDPKVGSSDYWLSGRSPSCPRTDCGDPIPTPGAEYGQYVDTKYQSSFFFGCQNTYKLAGQTSKHDNVVRCQGNGVWDFGDLRCEGPVCQDPGRPSDGIQVTKSYEQGSEIYFTCKRPGYILINPRPISCIREPECEIISPVGITSGRIPDSAINATSERPNYEAKNIRLNSVTGWCGKQEAFTYVSVDLGQIYRIKAILVKGVVTNDIVGRPTEIRFFYKQSDNENYVVYFPNFNLTMRDPGNYGELAMITLPKYVQARYVILGIVSYMDNACLKFELMGCEEPKVDPLLGYDYGYSPCVDNEPPVFHNCPQKPIVIERNENGQLLAVNFTQPTATDNSGSIARLEVKPQDFSVPSYIFKDSVVKYIAYDYDGNVAICEINITVPDVTPPLLNCPQSYVIELVDKLSNYDVNFNESRNRIKTFDLSGEVKLTFLPERSTIPVGGYQNVTVVATDKFNNEATCHFQVTIQATPCVDWELQPPENGNINCKPNDKGLKCIATCKQGFRFTDGDVDKVFTCQTSRLWKPNTVIPDCVSENTQQADYIVTASVLYRANGVVAQKCLEQYQDFLSQFYNELNKILSNRCSAVAVNMNVSFVRAIPTFIEENVLQIDFIMSILPAVKQPKLYDLCGSTLNLIFDLSVPDTSVVIEPLLVVPNIANQCPPLRALKSSISRGFSCNSGEVLNMDVTDVPRCLHCPAGTFAITGQSTCTPCPKGYYQNLDRQGLCLTCPPGTYTKEHGSKSISSCIAVCGFGTYSPTGMVPCLECPRNSFSGIPPLGGFKDCTSCPGDMYTFQPSASRPELCRTKCPQGSYSATGLEPCYTCPHNFYQSIAGSQTCNECPSNMKTDNIGAIGRENCKIISCSENYCNHGGLCVALGHTMQCFCPAGFSGERCEIDIDECSSQPCYNGGICFDMPQGYRCECHPGYSGINCQEEQSDCKNASCPTRAMCKNEPGFGNYSCLCRSGYTGNNCDVTIDPCSSSANPCQNDASCSALHQGRYKCNCLPGWEGIHCEININDCEENPCLLGANCTDLVHDFSCLCPNGFTGKRCEEKVDLCLSEPCKHGMCVDKLFSHKCICDEGWTGNSCDININDCDSNTCINNSTCKDLVNDYLCKCELGFTGKKCQHVIDYCESAPCQNGATCIDQRDGFICKCRPGYVGLQCEAEIDECLSNPCNAIGTEQCVDKDNSYQCNCRNGFYGIHCESDIDDCENEPCLNDGICRDKIGGFECICSDGWNGRQCEQKVNVCNIRNPCQNSAKCIDLFQDYFCACLSGTDGKNCETAPERCIGNPCMHNGKCQDFGSGLNCSCTEDYIGIGCQYEFDACEAGVCKNGASCIDNGIGYECVCPKGFTGKNCEQDIIDCNENSCPPGSTCVDLINSFYCQCSFNMTGDDCRKPVQIDYDLIFSDSRQSTASQIIPFSSKAGTSLTIAMWVQFTQKDDSGIFFTLYEVDSPYIADKKRILVQIHSSGVQVSVFSDVQDVFLPFKEYTTINDGQWHHIAVIWDGLQGQLQLITEGLIASKTEYVSGRILPSNLWIVLGRPQLDNSKSGTSYADVGFQGRITKAQIWSRALDIITEVQKQVRDCRNEPVLFNGLLLNWSGYDNITGIERSIPSICGKKKCPEGFSGPSCQHNMVDKEKPKVEFCPGDLWVIAKNGSALVTWDEPQFKDNFGEVSVIERNGYKSGQTLSWGIYEITYVGSDIAGNSEICSFKISVLDEFCPLLSDPIGGTQTCKDWGAGGQFKACEISCNPGLRFSQAIPDFYTCGAEGFWRPTSNPRLPFTYPSCSTYTPAQRVFRIEMLFPSDVLCNKAGQGVLRQKVFSSISSLNRDWNICSRTIEGSRECQNLDINVNCEHIRTVKKYAKRELNDSFQNQTFRTGRQQFGDTYTLEISFPANVDPVMQHQTGERSTIKQLLERLILVDDQFSVHEILPNTIPEPSSIILTSEYTCPAGQVVMEPDCVSCAIGTYYDSYNKTCIACEIGTYQSESGQLQCSKCPIIAGRVGVTIGTGSRSAADCKEKCPPGKFLDTNTGLCKACGFGFYQPDEGSFSCRLCDLGQTTRSIEATSKNECKNECESGMQLGLEGKCELCPKAKYRMKGSNAACSECPLGRTTLNKGSTSIEDCSLPVCKPGTYLNATVNLCINCRKGFYQPESQSNSCIACPPNYITNDTGATKKSDCSNPCENITVKEQRCNPNAYCILVPETSDFKCECKPGFNGTGYECKDVCDGFCENSGTCIKDFKGSPSCRCVGSFTGPHCAEKSEFAYIAGGIAAAVVFIIIIVLLIWMICVRSNKRRDPKKVLSPAIDQTGSQVNFYYGAHTPYAESIAPSHHSTYAHYYDDEEDGWEMPNFYNETYMKDGLHSGKLSTLARSNASLYGTKEDLYDRLKRHAYPGKKEKSDSDSEVQ